MSRAGARQGPRPGHLDGQEPASARGRASSRSLQKVKRRPVTLTGTLRRHVWCRTGWGMPAFSSLRGSRVSLSSGNLLCSLPSSPRLGGCLARNRSINICLMNGWKMELGFLTSFPCVPALPPLSLGRKDRVSLWTGELFVREGPAHFPSDNGGAGRRPRWGWWESTPRRACPSHPRCGQLVTSLHPSLLLSPPFRPLHKRVLTSPLISDISPLLPILGQERHPGGRALSQGPSQA